MSDGLYKRGGIWWLRCDPVTRTRRSTGCKSKPAAIAFRVEREKLAADPNYAASHTATIGLWAVELLEVKRSKPEGTQRMYKTKIGHVIRLFGRETKMVEITPPASDRFVAARRKEGASDSTIGKELTALVQMCKLAKRGGAYAGDIAALRPVGFSVGQTAKSDLISPEDARKLLGAFPAHKAAAAALAIAVGARASEVQRIRPEDVDLEGWTVHIPGTKTKKSDRTIPIVLPAHRALLRFALESGTLPVRWPRISKDIPAMAVKLGIPRVTPNGLRRSFSTWGIEAGISREDMAKLLGHGSTAMVFRHYGRESAAALGRKLARDIGTDPAQLAGTSGYCSGRPVSESSCFPAVAPLGVEPRCPEGPGILNPTQAFSGIGDNANTALIYAATVVPGLTASAGVRTDASQSAMRVGAYADSFSLSTAELEEQLDAHYLRILKRLAAVGFRAQSAAWFRRAP